MDDDLVFLLTLAITASFPTASRIFIHIPIVLTLCATGRLKSVNIFFASNLISMMLFIKANNGAKGKAATKIVTNPNCKTKNIIKFRAEDGNLYQYSTILHLQSNKLLVLGLFYKFHYSGYVIESRRQSTGKN